MADLDSMLAEDDTPMLDSDMGADELADVDEDPFTMHAETFLDDTMGMPERIEALRAAILAASAPPADDDLDIGADF